MENEPQYDSRSTPPQYPEHQHYEGGRDQDWLDAVDLCPPLRDDGVIYQYPEGEEDQSWTSSDRQVAQIEGLQRTINKLRVRIAELEREKNETRYLETYIKDTLEDLDTARYKTQRAIQQLKYALNIVAPKD